MVQYGIFALNNYIDSLSYSTLQELLKKKKNLGKLTRLVTGELTTSAVADTDVSLGGRP
jgi:hypothetical protein